ncbi:cytochrome c3 family protein [Indioceanicola profundi]|uniref:cytochrome c3 family protein n=1 Tax=Indioceanicola profundi TaxID=2220096 RepID=UPI000E6AC14D|nr:cytochrome c3 family protein [Indioceanicola profundi]
MAALFTPRADRILRRLAAAAVVAVLAFLVVATGIVDPGWFRGASAAPPQPVPFSHKIHVDDVGVDCRYCHTSVEVAADAGMPQMKTCMSCHLPLDPQPDMPYSLVWQRVQPLPDHAYFHHGAHISAGVGCSTCHGNVAAQAVPVAPQRYSMNWCLDCHRDPADSLRAPGELLYMDWTPPDAAVQAERLHQRGIVPANLDHCYVCHR